MSSSRFQPQRDAVDRAPARRWACGSRHRTFAVAAAGDLVTPEGLREIRGYADGIGTNKNVLVPRDASGGLLAPTSVVADAHRVG
jgi:glycerophosphoryl diester phosphodiesterase